MKEKSGIIPDSIGIGTLCVLDPILQTMKIVILLHKRDAFKKRS